VEGRTRQGNATKVFEFRNSYKQAIAVARFHLISTSFMRNLSQKKQPLEHSVLFYPIFSNSLNDASGALPIGFIGDQRILACHFEEDR
jgi:hypothetical protein